MFGSQVLDVVLGLVFVYLLLSIICTAVNEMIAALFSLRARNLTKGIANLLADKRVQGLNESFFDHPLIKSLYRAKKKPSYIPSHTFALAFLDGIAPVKGDGSAVMSEIKAAVNGLPSDSELRRVLQIHLRQAGDDFAKFRAGIETWFNDAMSRASGWYKRKSQLIIFIIAILATGLTNADTFQIVKSLSGNPALRATVAAQAQEFAPQQAGPRAPQPEKKSDQGEPAAAVTGSGGAGTQPTAAPSQDQSEAMTQALQNLQELGIPLGWQALPQKGDWANKGLGLLLTVIAVSLGAPFWFDILSKISKIRSTGAAPEATPKGKTEGNPA